MQRKYPADATLIEGEVELRVGTQEVNPAHPLPVHDAAPATPWIPTGVIDSALDGNTIVKASPGLLGWICVHATDNGGDIHVLVWDSPDAVTAGDTVVAQLRVTTTRTGAHRHDVFPPPGARCAKGIFLEFDAGDSEVTLGYK